MRISNDPGCRGLPLAKHKGKGKGMAMTSVRAYLQENNPEAINFDGLEDAIIGVGNQYTKKPLIIYSTKKILSILMKQGMTYDEALEYYETACLWAGEGTPIIMDDLCCDAQDQPTDQIRKDHALTPRWKKRRDSREKRKDPVRVQGSVRRPSGGSVATDR